MLKSNHYFFLAVKIIKQLNIGKNLGDSNPDRITRIGFCSYITHSPCLVKSIIPDIRKVALFFVCVRVFLLTCAWLSGSYGKMVIFVKL